MLSLTKIFLHNWHRFHHHVIAVQDSLYLAGHNGSGKSEALDPDVFTTPQKTISRRDLRQLARQRRGAQTYDHVGEYQADLLNRLGGLNERFFDLFLRALTFKPISNIREFVEKWLLPAQTLDVGNLQRVQERLADLRAAAK